MRRASRTLASSIEGLRPALAIGLRGSARLGCYVLASLGGTLRSLDAELQAATHVRGQQVPRSVVQLLILVRLGVSGEHVRVDARVVRVTQLLRRSQLLFQARTRCSITRVRRTGTAVGSLAVVVGLVDPDDARKGVAPTVCDRRADSLRAHVLRQKL